MYKTIFKQVASLQILLGFVMLIPPVVSFIYEEWYSIAGFIISAIVSITSGFIVFYLLKRTEEPEYKHALTIAAIGWLWIFFLGALPYYVIAMITPDHIMAEFVPDGFDYQSSLLNFRNPLHAIFESTSAFTTTGLTMALHEPSVGKTILFYRSFSQWIGGAGFIVLSLAIFRHIPGQGAIQLYGSEASGTKLRTNVIQTARAIWKAYLFVTIIVFIYLITGTHFLLPSYPLDESIFDAVIHAMSGQSTGGFSSLDDSIAGYHSEMMEWLFVFPMILGAFSLPFYYRLIFQGRLNEFRKDIQARAVLSASLFGGIILSLILLKAPDVVHPFREGIFQFISALSTTGWQTSDIHHWNVNSVLFIVVAAMIVGGSAGGTVGGIKIIRALLLRKGLQWHINKIFLPKKAVKSVTFFGRKLLPDEMNAELSRAGIFVLIYLLLLFISTVLTVQFMPQDFSLADAFFESASALSTVGLSVGITDPGMSPVLEVNYIIQMWAGRLEIFPVLILIRVFIYGTKTKVI